MLIKVSRGGGGNGYWFKDSKDHHMYDAVLETVGAACKQLAKKEKAIHFVKTDDLLKSGLYKDRLHFNNKSKEEIGRRFAKVMHKALAQ